MIGLYGISMAVLGALLVTWAIPYARLASQRRALYERAYNASLASLRRWNIGVWRTEKQAEAFAKGWLGYADANGFVRAEKALDEWIERAEHTNNLLEMPREAALDVVKEFRDKRFPLLRRKRA
jgi:hypothetical protein